MYNVKIFLENSVYVSHIFLFLFHPNAKNAASNLHKKLASVPPPKATSNATTSLPSTTNARPSTAVGRKQSHGSRIHCGFCGDAAQVWHGCVGVVCMMMTGQAWQFRPYKWNEPRQLFHNRQSTWSRRGSMGRTCGLTGSPRFLVRILRSIPSATVVALSRGFRTCSNLGDNTWYMTANSWLESAYHTPNPELRTYRKLWRCYVADSHDIEVVKKIQKPM